MQPTIQLVVDTRGVLLVVFSYINPIFQFENIQNHNNTPSTNWFPFIICEESCENHNQENFKPYFKMNEK